MLGDLVNCSAVELQKSEGGIRGLFSSGGTIPSCTLPAFATPLSLNSLCCDLCFRMAGSKSRKEAKNAKKEEQKQVLVAKLAEKFGRSVR